MNTDCWVSVFHYLSGSDFCSLARVCKKTALAAKLSNHVEMIVKNGESVTRTSKFTLITGANKNESLLETSDSFQTKENGCYSYNVSKGFWLWHLSIFQSRKIFSNLHNFNFINYPTSDEICNQLYNVMMRDHEQKLLSRQHT
jgi:hypothetical protein